jgi:hypothetical protein
MFRNQIDKVFIIAIPDITEAITIIMKTRFELYRKHYFCKSINFSISIRTTADTCISTP